MAEEHTAICEQCGRREPMTEKNDRYSYPLGWRLAGLSIYIAEPKAATAGTYPYQHQRVVCSTDCFEAFLGPYGLAVTGRTWLMLRVEDARQEGQPRPEPS